MHPLDKHVTYRVPSISCLPHTHLLNTPTQHTVITATELTSNIPNPFESGRYPMYVAVEKGLSEVVRVLVTRGLFGINEATTTEPSGATALHVAILHGQSHLIPMLLELGADVNQLDLEKFCSPLIMAIILQDEFSVRLLIQAGANANRLSREGRSAMYIAAGDRSTPPFH